MQRTRIKTDIDPHDARQRDLDALFAAIDAKDAEGFANFLTDDASFRFGPGGGRS